MQKHKLSAMTIAEFERRLRDIGSELEVLVQTLDAGEPLGLPSGADVSGLTRSRLAAELRRVETALLRLSKGRFGTCSRCEQPIEKNRLRADPAVNRCAPCAGEQAREARGRA